ncbi:MAG: hypothetical protein ACFFBR_03465 [Promethearchaeota archaeon]
MLFNRRRRGLLIGIIFLIVLILLFIYPPLIIGTPLGALFTIELAVVLVLFGGMMFLLCLLLYLGN